MLGEPSTDIDRVPPGRDAVELYVRTYTTILRSSGDVPVRALEQAHRNTGSSLHARADESEPDTGALIYALNRLPACFGQVRRVILGQLPENFAEALGTSIEDWQKVQAPARRRQWHFDGQQTLAVHVASPSDVDDLVPTLVAYQIEWNKLHARLNGNRAICSALLSGAPVDVARLQGYLGVGPDDWGRLERALGRELWPTLRAMAEAEKDLTLRLLGGNHVGYAKLTRRWWQPIGTVLTERGLARRPVYFVSP